MLADVYAVQVALLVAALVALLALCCTADAQRGAQELSATPRALLHRVVVKPARSILNAPPGRRV
jgi:hypothetical protein